MRRFRKQCQQHKDRIFTFALYFLGNREDAEDTTQEVLLRLWDQGRHFSGDHLAAWITKVTRNACIDRLRQRQSYQTIVQADPDNKHQDRAAIQHPDPAAQTEAGEFRRQLEQALSKLTEPHRSIVVLREIQQMSYEQIGSALDLPLNTVKVYLHRGRQQLRQHLKKSIDHD